MFACLSSVLLKNSRLDLDAAWGGGSKDEANRWGWRLPHRKVVNLGECGASHITSGEFVA